MRFSHGFVLGEKLILLSWEYVQGSSAAAWHDGADAAPTPEDAAARLLRDVRFTPTEMLAAGDEIEGFKRKVAEAIASARPQVEGWLLRV